MSHAPGVRCALCRAVLEPDRCPEGCTSGHGHTFQAPSTWAARTWPEHGCFAPERTAIAGPAAFLGETRSQTEEEPDGS